jgi:hypothetical protein
MLVYRCDLCNEIRDCAQRILEDKEYDICSECWKSLVEKLEGKGRSKKSSEIIALPSPRVPDSPDEPKPSRFPGAPPTVYGSAQPVN